MNNIHTLKGHRKSFVGGESWAECFPNGTKNVKKATKNVPGIKIAPNETENHEIEYKKGRLCLLLLHLISFHGLVRLIMAFSWSIMACSWSFVTFLFMVLNSKYLFNWTYIVFSRVHRSKFIWSCFVRFSF